MDFIIPVAVVGAGRFGAKHVEKYAASERAALVAIVDPDASVEPLARGHGARWFRSVDDLPAGLVRAATVAVPNAAHYEVGAALLRAGIDVLIEKPIALDLADADVLIELARTGQRILQVGHVERFNPAVLAVRPPLGSRRIHALRRGPPAGRADDADVVLDLMIHDIELAIHWAGTTPAVVSAWGERRSPAIDRAHALLQFADGTTAELIAERGAPCRTLRIESNDRRVQIDCLARRTHESGTVLRIAGHDPLAAQIDAFLYAVRRRSAPVVGGAQGRAALDVALRVREHLVAARSDSAA